MSLLSAKKVALGALTLSSGLGVNALWDCRYNQHVFPVDLDKFVVHFTSRRDSNYNDHQSWVRICLPNEDGYWENVDPIGVSCAIKGDTISKDQTKLDADLRVVAGQGCNSYSDALDGASITYKDQSINLMYGGDSCGPRDHGITCQFSK
ncbi:hypothetical protein BDV18DRAFT_160643 [Aspergillus unguis]